MFFVLLLNNQTVSQYISPSTSNLFNSFSSTFGKTFAQDLFASDPNTKFFPASLSTKISPEVQDPYLLARHVYCAAMQISGYFGQTCILPTNQTLLLPLTSFTTTEISYAQEYMDDILESAQINNLTLLTSTITSSSSTSSSSLLNNKITTTNDGRILDIQSIPQGNRVQFTMTNAGLGKQAPGASYTLYATNNNSQYGLPKSPASANAFEFGPNTYSFCQPEVLTRNDNFVLLIDKLNFYRNTIEYK